MEAIPEFPLIKLAKKLKDKRQRVIAIGCDHLVFPLIKLAKKLKAEPQQLQAGFGLGGTRFPLIKLAKKLKGAQAMSGRTWGLMVSIN